MILKYSTLTEYLWWDIVWEQNKLQNILSFIHDFIVSNNTGIVILKNF